MLVPAFFEKKLAESDGICYTYTALEYGYRRGTVCRCTGTGSERMRLLRASPVGHSAFDREPQLEGSICRAASDWVGLAVGIALRFVECAGIPANAGGTAEALSFVPFWGGRAFFFFHTDSTPDPQNQHGITRHTISEGEMQE